MIGPKGKRRASSIQSDLQELYDTPETVSHTRSREAEEGEATIAS